MKILLVDDSEAIRSELQLVIEELKMFSNILKATNGEEAIKHVVKESPDLIILDLEMPRMGGFTFLRWLMANRPAPVLIFSSLNTDKHIFKALEMGAVDFISKPEGFMTEDFVKNFRQKIETALEAKVNIASSVEEVTEDVTKLDLKPDDSAASHWTRILIGSSTGGPTAVQKLLQSIHNYVDTPVLVSQHMPATFTKVFAERLNSLLDYEVKEASHGDEIKRKTVYICPGDRHMEIHGKKIKLALPMDEDLYTPSVDKMLISAAKNDCTGTIGIILTGMGNDGAAGVKDLKKAGSVVIAESIETCVVFGMPKAAIATGCVDHVLPIERIGSRVVDMVNRRSDSQS